eukprot:848758-Rhodomonas_salina.2
MPGPMNSGNGSPAGCPGRKLHVRPRTGCEKLKPGEHPRHSSIHGQCIQQHHRVSNKKQSKADHANRTRVPNTEMRVLPSRGPPGGLKEKGPASE